MNDLLRICFAPALLVMLLTNSTCANKLDINNSYLWYILIYFNQIKITISILKQCVYFYVIAGSVHVWIFCYNHYTGTFPLILGYCMALQITRWNKTVHAFVTLLWLFSSVCTPHVDCQMTSCDAWKVTLWTFVRLFPRVGHLVLSHIYQSNWGISTLRVLMRLHPSVPHNVSL